MISVFDLFTIGIGPSSSHSVGPMRAGYQFVESLRHQAYWPRVSSITAELFGSLALTGIGHGTDKAVLMGLEGEQPELVDPNQIDSRCEHIRQTKTLSVGGRQPIRFDVAKHLIWKRREKLPGHPNALRFAAFDETGQKVDEHVYYSIGGGFIIRDGEDIEKAIASADYPFASAKELLEVCQSKQLAIWEVMLDHELRYRSKSEISSRLDQIWQAMRACVQRGCEQTGYLPGGLNVKRRAAALYHELSEHASHDPLAIIDWVNLYALAVNEENASGGRVVTAPTNGAAGIIPAVLHYYDRFCEGSNQEGIEKFLLTAAAIGMLYKRNASISGAEVGCQGEVGVACSMAAAGLTAVLGGSTLQVEQAAEIGMEHNLGLTCDPVKGLVQVPCIERNAMGAVKAINASRMALLSDGIHHVSLDRVIEVMKRTGRDMSHKYKETSRGGLAMNIPEC